MAGDNKYTRYDGSNSDTGLQAFISEWILCFGVPSIITTDQGRRFESSLWQQLMQLLGCNQIWTTSYYPMANGMYDRMFHRHLKSAIKSYPNTTDWVDSLPMTLLEIRTTLKQDCHCTSVKLVYGTTLLVPGEFFPPNDDTILDPSNYVCGKNKWMYDTLEPTHLVNSREQHMWVTVYRLVLMHSYNVIR